MSNFGLRLLLELQGMSRIPPMVVQRHADLLTQDWPAQLFCLSQGIQHVAYSTLGTQYMQQGVPSNPVLHNAAVQSISEAHNASAAQVRISDHCVHRAVVSILPA